MQKFFRFSILFLLTLSLCPAQTKPALPFKTRFVGVEKFEQLLKKAEEENWKQLPLSKRIATVGLALVGTPYKSYTLEIDDHIEAPSVNFDGVDCWTFFETSLAFARMLGDDSSPNTPEKLLHYIELDRYRGGVCDGTYLSRLHYLEDWISDNEKRGLVKNITRDFPEAEPMPYRKCEEMTVHWKTYRYMRENPDLRSQIADMEKRISSMEVWHIPKAKVPEIEDKLQDGDILCVTSHEEGGYTSHVGMAFRDDEGVVHFLHASSNYKKVTLDKRVSEYLDQFSHHAGIYIARPLK